MSLSRAEEEDGVDLSVRKKNLVLRRRRQLLERGHAAALSAVMYHCERAG